MHRLIIFSLFFTCLILSACLETKPDEDSPIEHETELITHSIPEGDLEILVIEGCEYIVYKDGRGSNHGFGYMSHKGNCNNPIHIYNDLSSDTLELS